MQHRRTLETAGRAMALSSPEQWSVGEAAAATNVTVSFLALLLVMQIYVSPCCILFNSSSLFASFFFDQPSLAPSLSYCVVQDSPATGYDGSDVAD